METWRSVKKVELHRHLEGAIRLQTLFESAQDLGLPLPTKNILELKNQAFVLSPQKSLKETLDKLELSRGILATPQIIERVSYEACLDAAAEGIRVLELRYSPGFVGMKHPKLTFDSIHQGVLRGVLRAEKELGGRLAVGLIGIMSKDLGKELADKTADFVIQNKDTFIGLDMAGDEMFFPISDFKPYFDKVRSAGLGLTVHSGEGRGRAFAENVKKSILDLGTKRIGHGIAIHTEPDIVELVKEQGVTLEVCPTSNVLTGVVGSIKDHPIVKLINSGVKVALGSDDPQFFGISLSYEYEVLARELGFSVSDFDALNKNAVEASFISKEKMEKAFSS
jgi:adenosine deaminase